MTRKIIVFLVVMLSAAALVTAMNQSFINRIKQDRYFDHLGLSGSPQSAYHQLFIRSDRWRYGDLYGLCYLPQFKIPLEPFTKYPGSNTPGAANRALYIIGDSFLADKALDGAFPGFGQVAFIDRRSPSAPLLIDKGKQNYMLLEFAERNLLDTTAVGKPTGQSEPPPAAVTVWARAGNILFNKNLSRNIELLLFDDKLFTGIKELKAAINYQLFGRVAKEVAVSSDQKRLFLNMTVDTGNIQSAFTPLTESQINRISERLAQSGAYYRSLGFEKTFLAIIPNAVSLYDANRGPYNHLLERIEAKAPLTVISVYQEFSHQKLNLFYRSDAHWNPHGFDLWLKTTGKALKNN